MDDLIYDVQDLGYFAESIMKHTTCKQTKKDMKVLVKSLIILENELIAKYHKLIETVILED
jgi:hypothetical protein